MLRGKNQFTSQRLAIIYLLEVSFPFATILLKHCGSFTVEKNWGFFTGLYIKRRHFWEEEC